MTQLRQKLLAFVILFAGAALLPLSLEVGQVLMASAASAMAAPATAPYTRSSHDIVVTSNVR